MRNVFFNKNNIIKKNPIYVFKFKPSYNSIIPLKIFQTWSTKILPPKMKQNVENLRKKHPRFQYFLFDDDDCRNFIKNNFKHDVLYAYDNLIPGAYKADLWRYCVLYIYGGVYLDIKFNTVNGFRFIALTEKEHFALDVPLEDYCNVYNGVMVSKPKNPKLLQSIDAIIHNVKHKYYGNTPLDPTGPGLFGNFFSIEEKRKMIVKRYIGKQGDGASINNILIFNEYKDYRNEQRNNGPHYTELWNNKQVYK